ncbi:related to multicopper oxidase [Phialocephala subalpina]|uniref:Related to multicopper oxidase n=1 Tax=Phialocephala subalpina TaxID=576137 RepID=A0A1L7WIT5_9HELO|nr:related to multicopper oxidase [Phialocephala subalpina]
MLAADGFISLLGRDNEEATKRWKQESEDIELRKHNRSRIFFWTFGLAIFFVPLAIFFILYLQWHSSFRVSGSNLRTPPGSVTTAESTRDLKVLLHPEDHVSRDPGTRHFSWNITKARIAPNGVQKEVFLINGRFPGPTVEARRGDTLEIEVFNFAEEEVSLHWHGLHMRGANHMDGPVGITQCAIKQGGNFTYRVPIGDQAGTFLQRADGLYGGLVVHSPGMSLDKNTYQYDKELLFMIGDWYHWPAAKVLANFMDRTSMGNEPCPDSLLINGLGYFECSMATHGAPVDCHGIKKPWLQLDKHYRYRVRLVNVGSLTGISFTIPDSEMKVIRVDGGQPVIGNSHPININSIGVLYPAERVDFVLAWPQKFRDTDTEITIELDNEYLGLRPNFALTPTQSFLLAAESATRHPLDNETDVVRFNLQDLKGPPLTKPLPNAKKTFMIYTAIEILNHLGSRPHGFINHTTWESQSLPLISLDREIWNSHQLVPWTGPEPVWIELTINNIDNSGHPFHLHGLDFYVIASYGGKGGWDYYNPFEPTKPPRGGPFNLVNPVRKDTFYVPPWGYVVIRFLADNEGIWTLHCHILWHAGSGMAMAFQVLGDEQKGFSDNVNGLSAKDSCTN